MSITGRYEAARPLSREMWRDWIWTALASVVEREPYLRVGIVDEDSTRACFVHVPRIDLDNQFAWHSAPCSSEEEYQSELAKVLADGHDSLWPDTATRPPWKATVVHGGDADVSRVDIIYSWHHAIGDGLSGKIFHESLLSALRAHDVPGGHQPLSSGELHFLDPPVLPPPQEEAVPFTLSWWYIFKTLWAEVRPSFLAPKDEEPVWAGRPVDFKGRYKTRVKLLVVDGKTRDGLLTVCRMHKTTLTGLVHALTLLSLAGQLPSESGRALTSQTPMSLRPYVSGPTTDLAKSMSVLVGTCQHQFRAEQLQTLQSLLAEGELAGLECEMWSIATDVKTDLKDKAVSLPADDVMGLLSMAGDWRARFRQMDGKPPKTTWEVSNVGVIDGGDSEGSVRVSRLLFSQSAALTGSALNTSIAGCEGAGGVGIAWTWAEGVLEEGLVESVVEDIGTWMESLARSGRL